MEEIIEVNQGLKNVVVDTTKISCIDLENKSLSYRSYPVAWLCENLNYDEVSYLLWNSKLPNPSELEEFSAQECSHRLEGLEVFDLIRSHSQNAHAMDILRTCVSFIGANSPSDSKKITSIKLYSLLPVLLASVIRHKQGLELIEPTEYGSSSENFLYMCFAEHPSVKLVSIFDKCRILYAEHSFNAATFVVRTVSSTESDMFSAVSAGISALKGTIHGGAIEGIIPMLLSIGAPSQVPSYLATQFAEKQKVMGFGHRIYQEQEDLRISILRPELEELVQTEGLLHKSLFATAKTLEEQMAAKKSLYANLDLPMALAYQCMGFNSVFFSALIAISRHSGWLAHFTEQAENNKIIRPMAKYVGDRIKSQSSLNSSSGQNINK